MNDEPLNSRAMRVQADENRSQRVINSRDGLVVAIRRFLDVAQSRMETGQSLGALGSINSGPGIAREVVANPFGAGTNFLAEHVERPGAYFSTDPSGRRSLVLNTGTVVHEVTDNPLEQSIAGPEAGYNSGQTEIASFMTMNTDGTSVGARIFADGDTQLRTRDADGFHGTPLVEENLADLSSAWKGVNQAVGIEPPGMDTLA